jgi:hypothetical protein
MFSTDSDDERLRLLNLKSLAQMLRSFFSFFHDDGVLAEAFKINDTGFKP